MRFKRLVIIGGAGFVGSNLAVRFRQCFAETSVVALDNLRRRGSELALDRLRQAGVQFRHGDVRSPEDLASVGDFDLLIECAAEPSVQAGVDGPPMYLLNSNLVGTIHCLEAARAGGAAVLFLSTSRIYPIERLNALPFVEEETRFRWTTTLEGIAEDFPLDGARSLYGASKLAGELLVREYVYNYGMKALINRCGILAGPWQMGKVDQGVVTLWTAAHAFGRPLQYMGFGGKGKQVRDILHIDDLFDLLVRQIESPHVWDGRAYNVGGGGSRSASLLELTQICQAVTGRQILIESVSQTSRVDVRVFITDTRSAHRDFGWQPGRGVEQIVQDIYRWIVDHRNLVEPILG